LGEKLKSLGTKVLEILKKVPKNVYILAASLIVVALIVIVVLSANRPYSVLFTGLSTSDLSTITSYLEGQGITDYKIENNDTVLVRESQEASLKARLLMEGYPKTGFSYSHETYFGNVGMLSTESERKTVERYDLQEKMSAVVRCFDNVKNASVDISFGQDNGYILDKNSKVEASASVVVEMQGTSRLTSDQALAIRRYIANAVQGLSFERVDITDTMGNRYGASNSLADADASALKFQLEEDQANVIRSEVMLALLPFYGTDNVRVAVNCTVDVSQRTVSSRDVFLPNYAQNGSTNGEGIKGEQIYEYWVTREGDSVVGGLVGAETNSDVPEYVENAADPNGSEQELGGSGSTVYDNPYEETVAIYTAGYLTDCSISVSINAAADTVDVQALREHVARAAGIQGKIDPETGIEYLADQISVVVQPFYEEPVAIIPPPDQWIVDEWIVYAAAGGLALFLILLLIIILSVRRKRKKKKKLEQERQKERNEILLAAGVALEDVPEGGADVMTLQTERSMELRKDIRQFSDDNPEIAAQMLRGWLRGGDGNG